MTKRRPSNPKLVSGCFNNAGTDGRSVILKTLLFPFTKTLVTQDYGQGDRHSRG